MVEAGAGKAEGGKGGERTVLIVDDEAATRRLLKSTVKGLGIPCKIVEAVDGDQAVALAQRERPDLALVDIVLPGSSRSGVLVCQELLKVTGTKVVIVTGQASDSITQSCLSLGATDCIRKPFSVAEMREKLQRWLSD